LWLSISYSSQVHEILLQLCLIRCTLIELAQILIVEDGKNQLLVLVQVLLNEFCGDVGTGIRRHVLHHGRIICSPGCNGLEVGSTGVAGSEQLDLLKARRPVSEVGVLLLSVKAG